MLNRRGGGEDYQVFTDDGVGLHARVEGNADAPLTVVFCHGGGMNAASWVFQRRALASAARVVCFDQRGHGQSGHGPRGSASIGQLGRDLRAVLDYCAAEGRVVLVGHSMGGTTIMALAAAHPELFGQRVRGVVLVATSAGPVGIPSLGVLPSAAAYRALGQAASTLEPVIRLLARLPGHHGPLRELILRCGFASPLSPSIPGVLAETIAATPVGVLAELLLSLGGHNQLRALPPLRRVPTLVLVGEHDPITPPRHAREIAAALPEATLVVVPRVGHLLPLERPVLVNQWLRVMLRAAAGEPAASGSTRSA